MSSAKPCSHGRQKGQQKSHGLFHISIVSLFSVVVVVVVVVVGGGGGGGGVVLLFLLLLLLSICRSNPTAYLQHILSFVRALPNEL